MPTFAAGHGTARLKAAPSPQFGRQDPSAPSPSHRKPLPSPQLSSRSSRSSRSSDPRYPPRRPQIPIGRANRATEPRPPAVSPPEASRTPAIRVSGNQPSMASVREPLTTANLGSGSSVQPILSRCGHSTGPGRNEGNRPRSAVHRDPGQCPLCDRDRSFALTKGQFWVWPLADIAGPPGPA